MTKHWITCGDNRASFDTIKEAAEVYRELTYNTDSLCRKNMPLLSEAAKQLLGEQIEPKISLTTETIIPESGLTVPEGPDIMEK